MGSSPLVDELARALSFCLAALFLLAAWHKTRVLRIGDANAEPLIRIGRWRRRHADPALFVAAIAELATGSALLAYPPAGLIPAIALATTYAFELRQLDSGEPCRCFGSVLEVSPKTAITRNVIIAALAGVALAGYLGGSVAVAPISGQSVGLALLVTSVPAGLEVLRRTFQEQDRHAASSQKGGYA